MVFYIHEIYISREETMVFDAQVLFNYAKVNTVFHFYGTFKVLCQMIDCEKHWYY